MNAYRDIAQSMPEPAKTWVSPTCETLSLQQTAGTQFPGVDGGGHANSTGCSGSNCAS
jgi:hypothetical protein